MAWISYSAWPAWVHFIEWLAYGIGLIAWGFVWERYIGGGGPFVAVGTVILGAMLLIGFSAFGQ